MPCPYCRTESARPAGGYPCRKPGLFKDLSLSRCWECGLIFAEPMPTKGQLDEYYKSAYWLGDAARINPVTEAYYAAQSLARLDFVGREPKSFHRVLDIGAGSGALYKALRERGFEGSYDAVEPDETQAAAIKSWKAGVVFRGLAEVAACEYDLIFLSHVLEHVPDPQGLLESVVQLLSPRSLLFVEVPNRDHDYKTDLEGHVLFFCPETLKRLLSSQGRVPKLKTCGKTPKVLREQFLREDAAGGGLKALLPAGLKRVLKHLLGREQPEAPERLREKFCLDVYSDGDDLQWIRALLEPAEALARS